MTHDCEYRDRIEDFAGGLASPEETAALTAHLARCPACAALARDVARLDAAAAALPHEIPPAHDLWPGIAGRLADEHSTDAGVRRRFRAIPRSILALAAAVAGLLLLSHALTGRDVRHDPATILADGYGAARAACELSLDGIAADIGPDDVRELRRGVAAIERAVAETRGALENVNGDPAQTRRLAAGYHRKIDLLQRLANQTVRS